MDTADLKLLGMVINEPGFALMENEIFVSTCGLDSVDRITGNAFKDGMLKGEVKALSRILRMFNNYRKELKSLKDD